MYSLLNLLLLCVILFIFFYTHNDNKTKTINDDKDKDKTLKENENFENIKKETTNTEKNPDKIRMIIFVATWCGACNSYKKNIHNNLSKELQNIYNNIEFEFIVDDPDNQKIKDLQKFFEIKYFPTIILYKNDDYKILPMNEPITSENIVKLINSI